MIWSFLIISLGLVSARESVGPQLLDELRASGQHEKFAELLGIDKSLVDTSEQRSEGSIFNHASALGDIMLTEEQERQGLNFNKYRSSRWPNGRVPYWIGGDFTSDQRKTIENGINLFNQQVRNVKIVPWQNGDEDYIYVYSGSGCWSYLGKVGGQQALSLQQNGCVSIGTTQHEFIHAIGFTHEQNRSDRDKYVTVLWDNIPSSWHSQYYKVEENDYPIIANYDWYSVMHYPIWAPETYKDAFKLPRNIDRNRLGGDAGITQTDVQKINTLYS